MAFRRSHRSQPRSGPSHVVAARAGHGGARRKSLAVFMLLQTSHYFNIVWVELKQIGNKLLKLPFWKKDRTKILTRCSIHLPPLVITAILIYLNFSVIFFSPLGTPNQNLKLNALQFAAKLHEVTIVASLSIVAIDCVQYELLRGKGLSLGGVLTGFQVTNLISLWSPGLWNRCLTPGFRTHRIRFVLLVILLTIMTTIVGPSSAILMLPSVGWWDVIASLTLSIQREHNASGNMVLKQEAKFFLADNESLIWPTLITTSNYLLSDCTFVNTTTTLQDYCPAAGLPIILTQAWDTENPKAWSFTMPTNTTPSFNRPIQGIVAGENNVALTKSTASSVDNALISICLTTSDKPSAFPNSRLSENENVAWNLTLHNGTQVLAPQTFVFCNTELLTSNYSSNQTVLPGQQLTFPLRGGQSWSMDSTPLLNLWNSSNSLAALWIEPPYLHNNTPSISLALIGNTSNYESEGVQSSQHPETQLVVAPEIVTCSVYASWHPGDVSIDFDIDTAIRSSTMDNDLQYWHSLVGPDDAWGLDIWAVYNQTDPNTREVQLDVDWANLALPPALTVGPIISTITGLQPDTRSWAAGPAISLLVTDAMARFGALTEVLLGADVATQSEIPLVQYASEFLVQNLSTLDMGNSTALKITRSQYGYSYSMMGLTRRLGAGVLLTHALIALIHTIIVVWYRWRCPGLKSLGDLFMLTVNSSRPATPGNALTDKHKCTIQVRQIADDQLGLEIDGQGGSDISTDASDGGEGELGEDLEVIEGNYMLRNLTD